MVTARGAIEVVLGFVVGEVNCQFHVVLAEEGDGLVVDLNPEKLYENGLSVLIVVVEDGNL